MRNALILSTALFLLTGCLSEWSDGFSRDSNDGENEVFLIEGECGQDTIIVDDFLARAYQIGLIEAIRPDLLALYVDLDQMIADVQSKQELIKPYTTDRFFKSAIECSLFQLGWSFSDLNLYNEGEIEEIANGALTSDFPPVWGTSLMLSAGKYRSIDCQTVLDFANRLRETLWELTTGQGPVTEQAKLFGQYLLFSDFFRIAPDTELVEAIKAQRFPNNQLEVRENLDLDLLYDIDSAARLAMDMNTERLAQALEASWTNGSYFHISDCPDSRCQLKSFQVITFTKTPGFILDDDKTVAMLGYLLARIEDGAYQHPEDFGLSPDILWDPYLPCDYNCTASHWATTMALNVMLDRLHDREDDIRSAMALWQNPVQH